jgi:tetratricopeptide (TPR) repeat protein
MCVVTRRLQSWKASVMATTLNLDRLAEPDGGEKARWPTQSERNGNVLRRTLFVHSDAELVGQLAQLGIDLDRETLRQWAAVAGSAEELACALKVQGRTKPEATATEHAWVWAAIAILWERWFPDLPSFEMLDDLIGDGTGAEGGERCKIWLDAWRVLVRLAEKLRIDSVRGFDERFRGIELLQNWVQDLEMEMGDLARPGRDLEWFQRRAQYCEAFLARFPNENQLLTQNMRRAWAESLYGIGETRRSDDLFENWLKEDPLWSWGWIGLADNHLYDASAPSHLERAEQILLEGLTVERIQDKDAFYERLEYIYQQQNRKDKAAEMSALAKQWRPAPDRPASAQPPEPVQRSSPKVGRNDPCPCGSGKKFKKCCGA